MSTRKTKDTVEKGTTRLLRLKATVCDGHRHNSHSTHHLVKVIAAKSGDQITISYTGKEPRIVERDIIFANVYPEKDGIYKVHGSILIDIKLGEAGFRSVFERWKRFTYKKYGCKVDAKSVYDAFIEYRPDKNEARKRSTIGDVFGVRQKMDILATIASLRTRLDQTTNPLDVELTPMQLNAFLNFWHREVDMRRLWSFGITQTQIDNSGYTTHELYEKIVKNPFSVAIIEEAQCHHICMILDRKVSTRDILNGKLLRQLWNAYTNGSSFIRATKVCEEIRNYSEKELLILREEYDILLRDNRYYLRRVYYIEKEIRRFLLLHVTDKNYLFSSRGNDSPIEAENNEASVPREWNFQYDVELDLEQQDAIRNALTSPQRVVCITGQAGSGKTRVVSQLVRLLRRHNVQFNVFAFTGAASSRVNDLLQENVAMTFHRSFGQALNPEIVIIDESSMTGAELLYLLLLNLSKERLRRRFIFVGDYNQLQPIGWGRLFNDIIQVERLPVMLLTKCHRNDPFPGKPDGIIPNSMSMLSGDYMPVDAENFRIIESCERQAILDVFRVYYESGVPQESIAIICAYRKYGSIDYFNRAFLKMYRPMEKLVYDNKKRPWALGALVVSLVNNYDANVMNGDRGVIVKINSAFLKVEYPPMGGLVRKVKYSLECEYFRDFGNGEERMASGKYMSTDEIDLGYALSIYKAQGHEYAHCGAFFDPEGKPGNYLNQHLAYTTFTRAKTSLVVVVRDGQILNEISRSKPFHTYTDLVSSLKPLPAIERSYQEEDEYF